MTNKLIKLTDRIHVNPVFIESVTDVSHKKWEWLTEITTMSGDKLRVNKTMNEVLNIINKSQSFIQFSEDKIF